MINFSPVYVNPVNKWSFIPKSFFDPHICREFIRQNPYIEFQEISYKFKKVRRQCR